MSTNKDNDFNDESLDNSYKKSTDINNSKSSDDYYDDLYKDLPKEVVQILMQTHPLMGKETSHTKNYDRHPQKEKVSRKQPENYDQNDSYERDDGEFYKDPHKNHYKDPHKDKERAVHKQARPKNRIDDDEPSVQYVKRREPSKRPPRRTVEIDDDLGHIEKKATLDAFFRDNEDYDVNDDHTVPLNRKVALAGIIVAVLAIGILAINNASLSKKLVLAEEKVIEHDDLFEKNEELKLNILSLEEELRALKDVDNVPEGGEAGTTDPTDNGESEPTTPTQTGEMGTYTAEPGDNYWIISKKIYGDASYVKKILDANGAKEGDLIHPGQEIKYPKE